MGKKTQIWEPIDTEALRSQVVPLTPLDTMGEAGRKILLNSFVQMLDREAGTRAGEDIEDLHRMRVATRHMRSAFLLFAPYFKQKHVRVLVKRLKTLAGVLGAVRDLDVMVHDLTEHQSTLDGAGQLAVQQVVTRLQKRCEKARKKLITFLDSKQYRVFTHDFATFLTKPARGLKSVEVSGPAPYQIRHVLPGIMHHYLAAVRAYDTVLDTATLATLHALRIDFKRLRYTMTHFSAVLGKSSESFLVDVKVMQDYLGRLNDISVAQPYLDSILTDDSFDEAHRKVLTTYLTQLAEEETRRLADFREVWDRFNSRTVQRKLSDSLLVLR